MAAERHRWAGGRRLARTRAARAVFALAATAFAVESCVADEVDLTDRVCPCTSGYVCDQPSRTCVPRFDAGIDAGADAGVDGGSDGGADGGPDGGFTGLFCQRIEAEDGVLASPMQAATDLTASADWYVVTAMDEAGSATYAFDLPSSGDFLLQARVLTPLLQGTNSFYVGLDGEVAQGDDTRIYDLIETPVFAWDTVRLRGSATDGGVAPEFDPMIWTLSAEAHTFTFFGREVGTWLDVVALRQCPVEGGCAAITDFGCPAPDAG